MKDIIRDTLNTFASIPPFKDIKNALFVGPHPDDIEFGCGATISKLVEGGTTIHFVIVTDGGAGSKSSSISVKDLVETRRKESISSFNFLKGSTIDFLNLEDAGTYSEEEVIKLIAPLILKYQPEIVFSPDPLLKTECHLDHIKCGLAIRHLSQLIAYPTALLRHGIDTSFYKENQKPFIIAHYFSDSENYFEEVNEEQVKKKLASLSMHESQFKSEEEKKFLDFFYLKAVIDGKKNGTSFAECFSVITPIMQHVYSLGLDINKI